MNLRFQLPREVLPFQVERARLAAKIEAPSRRLLISGRVNGKPVVLHRAEGALDPIQIDITDPRWLQPDGEGGLYLNVSLGEPPGSTKDEQWRIEYLELDVTGRRTEKENGS
jgi:hypothetical protein